MNNPHLSAFLKSIYQIQTVALSTPALRQAPNR
jgi:hypothetical protein